jgi:hypothetical protein
MLTKDEMQYKIDYEIIVDCYDEYEVSMGWYYYMEESLKFPFTATAEQKMADGKIKLTEIKVTGLASDEEGFMGKDFAFEMLKGEHFSNIWYSKLSQINGDDETLEALAVWDYWNSEQR